MRKLRLRKASCLRIDLHHLHRERHSTIQIRKFWLISYFNGNMVIDIFTPALGDSSEDQGQRKREEEQLVPLPQEWPYLSPLEKSPADGVPCCGVQAAPWLGSLLAQAT